jgi:hypothetical protein
MKGESLQEFLFHEARAKPTVEERQRYLDRMCRGRPALRRDLDELLAAHDRLCRAYEQRARSGQSFGGAPSDQSAGMADTQYRPGG